MSIYSGQISFSRYRLIGDGKVSIGEIDRLSKKYSSKPVKIDGVGTKEMTYGWTSVGLDEESSDAHWSLSEGMMGDGLLLRIRIDQRKVPRQLAKSLFLAKIAERADEPKAIGRAQKKALWEELMGDLRDRALPTISYLDLYWQFSRSTLFIFSTARKSLEIGEELFKKTFCRPLDMVMVKIGPPLLSLDDESWKGDKLTAKIDALAKLVPSMDWIGQQNLPT